MAVVLVDIVAIGLSALLLERWTDAVRDPRPLVTVPAQELSDELRQPVSAEFAAERAAEVTTAGALGVITEVDLEAGDVTRNGMRLGAVNGVGWHLCEATPIVRPIGSGDRGADVVALRRCLVDMGLLRARSEAEDVVDPELVAAIDRLAFEVGVVPTGQALPNWFAFTAAAGWTVDVVAIEVGAPVPPIVAASAVDPASGVVAPDAEVQIDAFFALAMRLGAAVTVESGGTTAEVGSLDEVFVVLAGQAASAPDSPFAPSSGVLVVGRPASDRPLAILPLAAVYASGPCVYERIDDELVPRPVEIVGELGQSAVVSGVDVGTAAALGVQRFGQADCDRRLVP